MIDFIQYIDRLKRWEWGAWLKMLVLLTVLNFLVISMGVFSYTLTPATSLTFTIMSRAYELTLLLWIASIVGAGYARYRQPPTTVI